MGIIRGLQRGFRRGFNRGPSASIYGSGGVVPPVIIMPSVRSVGGGVSAIGNLLVTAPGALTVSDVELMVAECIQSETFADPAGWTQLSASPQVAAATKLTAWWRRWDGAAGDPTLTGPANHAVAYRVAFMDCIASGDPIDAIQGAIAASSVNVSCPTINTLTANDFVVNICAAGTDIGTPQFSGEANASLSGFAEIQDFFAIAGGGGGIGMWGGGKAGVGGVVATTATLAAASSQGLITLALKGRIA